MSQNMTVWAGWVTLFRDILPKPVVFANNIDQLAMRDPTLLSSLAHKPQKVGKSNFVSPGWLYQTDLLSVRYYRTRYPKRLHSFF